SFCRYLLNKEPDCQITVLDNLSAGKRENLPLDKRLTFFGTDIRHISLIPDLQKDWSDAISLNFSGIAPLPINELNPQFAISNNLGGTAEWLNFHKKWGIKRCIFASSNSVYENNEDKKEDSDLFPDLVYPLTKKWGEELCSAYNKNYGLPTVSLRFSNVYGPAANSEREQPALFSYLIRELLNNRTPTIYNSSKARRDYIYVDDLCELLYLI